MKIQKVIVSQENSEKNVPDGGAMILVRLLNYKEKTFEEEILTSSYKIQDRNNFTITFMEKEYARIKNMTSKYSNKEKTDFIRATFKLDIIRVKKGDEYVDIASYDPEKGIDQTYASLSSIYREAFLKLEKMLLS